MEDWRLVIFETRKRDKKTITDIIETMEKNIGIKIKDIKTTKKSQGAFALIGETEAVETAFQEGKETVWKEIVSVNNVSF